MINGLSMTRAYPNGSLYRSNFMAHNLFNTLQDLKLSVGKVASFYSLPVGKKPAWVIFPAARSIRSSAKRCCNCDGKKVTETREAGCQLEARQTRR